MTRTTTDKQLYKKDYKITDSNAKSNIKILIKVYLKSGNSARYK